MGRSSPRAGSTAPGHRRDAWSEGRAEHGHRAALTQIEGAVADHLALTGSDPAVEPATQALLTALSRRSARWPTNWRNRPPTRSLPNFPTGSGRRARGRRARTPGPRRQRHRPVIEDLDARLTLRIPAHLKQAVESAAQQLGDSVNSFVVSARGHTSGGEQGPDRQSPGPSGYERAARAVLGRRAGPARGGAPLGRGVGGQGPDR